MSKHFERLIGGIAHVVVTLFFVWSILGQFVPQPYLCWLYLVYGFSGFVVGCVNHDSIR